MKKNKKKKKRNNKGFGAYEFLTVAVVCLVLTTILLVAILKLSNKEKYQVFNFNARVMAMNAINYNLKDEFYFVNVTNIKDDENFYKEINNTFNTKLINNIPCILHFKNNELKKVIYNKDLNKTYTNFENLLKENEFDKE